MEKSQFEIIERTGHTFELRERTMSDGHGGTLHLTYDEHGIPTVAAPETPVPTADDGDFRTFELRERTMSDGHGGTLHLTYDEHGIPTVAAPETPVPTADDGDFRIIGRSQ